MIGLFWQISKLKHPNPFYLGTLKKTLTEKETEEMYNTMKWVRRCIPLLAAASNFM